MTRTRFSILWIALIFLLLLPSGLSEAPEEEIEIVAAPGEEWVEILPEVPEQSEVEAGAYEPEIVPAFEILPEFVIEDGVLTGYNGEAEEVALPEEVRVVGAYAFADNHVLRSVGFPEGLTAIEEYAFLNCDQLAQVEIPAGTRVDEGAFEGCTRLVLPDPQGNDEVQSRAAELRGKAAPVIKVQPQDITVAAGEKGTISISAIGSGLSYQWQFMNAGESKWQTALGDIATSASMTMTMRKEWDGRQFRCVITDQDGSVMKSNRMTLHVTDLPAPAAPDKPVLTASGTKLRIAWSAVPHADAYSVHVSPTGKWADGTTTYVGNTQSCTLNDLTYDCWYAVWVFASNATGTSPASPGASLKLTRPPVITRQPESLTAAADEKATISIGVWGEGLAYQWQWMDPEGSKWFDAGGEIAKGPSMTMTMRREWDGRQFRCIISDGIGNTIKSNRMTLTVIDLPVPEAPALKSLQPGEEQVVLSWDPVPHAARYDVYINFNDRQDSAWILGSATEPQYIARKLHDIAAEAGTTSSYYFFWLKAVNAAGESGFSNGRMFYAGAKPANSVVVYNEKENYSYFKAVPENYVLTVSEGEPCDFNVRLAYDACQWQYRVPGGSLWVDAPEEEAKQYRWRPAARKSWEGRQFRCRVTLNGYTQYTPPLKLHVVAPRPAVPTVTRLTSLGNMLVVAWEPDPNADQYRIRFYASGMGVGNANIKHVGNVSSTTISGVGFEKTYYVAVAAGNEGGYTEYSKNQAVTVITPPTITQQPANLSVPANESGTVSVKATGKGLTYQWQFRDPGDADWKNCAGATQAEMTAGMRPEWNGRQYRCIATDKVGNYVKSDACTLTVTAPRKPPAPDEVWLTAQGNTATVHWTRMPSATNYIVYVGTVDDIARAKAYTQGSASQRVFTDWAYDTYYYVWVRAKNSLGVSEATTAKLYFHAPVSIINQPRVISHTGVSYTNFAISISYTKGTNCQWQHQDPETNEWIDFSGATLNRTAHSIYTPSFVGHKIRCVVTDDLGNRVISESLTVEEYIPPVTSLKFNGYSYSVKMGSTIQLASQLTVTPTQAAGNAFTWQTDDPKIATVKSGVVTPVAPGSTRITVIAPNGIQASCTVRVSIVYVTTLKLDVTTVTVKKGETVRFTVTQGPENATNPVLTASSNDADIAQVTGARTLDATHKEITVRGVAAGTAFITVRTQDGGNRSVICTVNVTE